MGKCKICNGRKEIEVLVMGTDTAWVECYHCKPDPRLIERKDKLNKIIYKSKTNQQPMIKKKTKPTLNLKVYKKICELVKIVTIYDEDDHPINYLVQSRINKRKKWDTIFKSISLKKAIQKKHFQVLSAIHILGYRQDFLARRKRRK